MLVPREISSTEAADTTGLNPSLENHSLLACLTWPDHMASNVTLDLPTDTFDSKTYNYTQQDDALC